MKKRIAFLMRFDYIEKTGGDVVQVGAYSRGLERLGYECVITNDLNALRIDQIDYFVLVNVDRPIETLYFFNTIRKANRSSKIVLVPIHHPIEAINRFERYKKGIFFRALCGFIPDFYGRERIKNLIRFRKGGIFRKISVLDLFRSYRARLSSMLKEVDGLIYISEGEKSSLESDFGFWSKRYLIAKNAVDLEGKMDRGERLVSNSIDVIAIGRIEPRKNQLTIIRSLANLNLNVAFVGHLNQNEPDYCAQFLKSVGESGGRITYLGGMDHSQVLLQLANSRLLLNASYFEVNPLVDLEAALLDVPVVTTKYSYTRESLPAVVEVDPWDDNSIRSGVEAALSGAIDTLRGKDVATSWDNAVAQIDLLLRSL